MDLNEVLDYLHSKYLSTVEAEKFLSVNDQYEIQAYKDCVMKV